MKDLIKFLEQKESEGFTIDSVSMNVEHIEEENRFSAWKEYKQGEIELKIILKNRN